MDRTLQPELILADLGKFAVAFQSDLWIAALGFCCATLLGAMIAALLRSGARPVRVFAFLYVQTARGVPMFVLLYWVYFGLATGLAIPLTALQAALIALTLAGSGYTAEVLRSGLETVELPQFEAAHALGLAPVRIYADIVVPQALRRVLPPLASVFIIMLQWTTLVSVISVREMLFVAHQAMLQNFRPFEANLAVVIIMLAAVGTLSLGVGLLERRLGVPR